MVNRTKLGKISKVSFGYGGYQDAQFGLSVTLSGESWGVGDFKGFWASRPTHADWTVEDQTRSLGETALYLRDLLRLAKKQEVHELVGVPVEVTFDGNMLKEWRILEEVL